MHTYPKLNSVAVSGRTRNAYWQSLFLCSSSSSGRGRPAYTIHPAASRIQNRCSEAENTRSALLLDSQIVLTMGCTALRCRGCVMEDTASQVVGCNDSLAALVASRYTSSCSSPPPPPVEHFIKLKLCPWVQTTEVTGGGTQSFSFIEQIISHNQPSCFQ